MEADESSRISQTKTELKTIILEKIPENGYFDTGIPGVFFVRRDLRLAIEHRFDRPLASLIVQGTKKICDWPERISAGCQQRPGCLR